MQNKSSDYEQYELLQIAYWWLLVALTLFFPMRLLFCCDEGGHYSIISDLKPPQQKVKINENLIYFLLNKNNTILDHLFALNNVWYKTAAMDPPSKGPKQKNMIMMIQWNNKNWYLVKWPRKNGVLKLTMR